MKKDWLCKVALIQHEKGLSLRFSSRDGFEKQQLLVLAGHKENHVA
jgi:hypothetical protein